jgi:hypothetical protein
MMSLPARLLALLFLPGLLLVSLGASAAPVISAQQRNSLDRICAGTGAALGASSLQSGVVLYDTTGSVPATHDELPAALRAAAFANAGLVLCITARETTLEACNNIFFSFIRIRVDQDVRVVSVRDPANTLASTRLQGSAPPTCNNVGSVPASTTAVRGDKPTSAALLQFLDASNINTGDNDKDGHANLAELIQGFDIGNAAIPGALVVVTANNSSALGATTDEAVTVKLSFMPGAHNGKMTDYYLWAETDSGNYSYIYPDQLVASAQPQLSVRAPAQTLADFPVLQFQQLPAGDYTLHFEARIDGVATYASTASLAITTSNWQFAEVSTAAGLTHTHGYNIVGSDISRDRQYMAAGVAAGDYDKDGWVDLYVTRGSIGPNLLYRNRGDGTFENRALAAGVALSGEYSGATFADYDGDGWLDLLVSGINTTTQPVLFRNNRDGSFTNNTSAAGIPIVSQSMGSTFADYDRDGDLDFWMTHWTASSQQKYLWRNTNGVFADVSAAAGIPNNLMGDYTVNFADINNDGWPDILVAADFSTSQVYLNQKNGTFANATTNVIRGSKLGGTGDENGMGAAVGDYDNDLDLDWFVSSIFDDRSGAGQSGLTWGTTGNRLYNNQGGTFADFTTFTGTREGGWGWGSCFADFNNDGFLDLFQVNGYDSADGFSTAPFEQDPSRLFINDREGHFVEQSALLGIDDRKQGRGIVCFDYDRDGDLDIFVANNEQKPLLYENRGLGASRAHWLHVRIAGEQLNSEGIGARIYVSTGATTQMRELTAGSNFMSQNPVLGYFGLGTATSVDSVRVVWPSGVERTLDNVDADQILYVTQ